MSLKLTRLVLALSFSLLGANVWAQEVPAPQELLQQFGISQNQVAQLEKGDIVSFEVSETSQKELAIGVAMLLPVALPKIVDYIKNGQLSAIETDLLASGAVSDSGDVGQFKKWAFTDKQLEEAKAFLQAEAGDEFNLSKDELGTLQNLPIDWQTADKKTLLKTANQTYRQFLWQRFQAYRQKGLAGIAAYARDGTAADPAAELRTDALHSKAWSKYFPALQQAWLNYPANLPDNAIEQFVWMNRRVENRPTAILNHRVLVASDAGGIMLSRQFYVGHSYNSSQVVAGGLPYKEGSLVFYATRSSTDQVAGMGSSLKHAIGREQMKKEMIKRLQGLNKALKRKPAAIAAED